MDLVAAVRSVDWAAYDTGAYDDVRDDHERLGRLIDERARLRDP
jgi:hypothetical protein